MLDTEKKPSGNWSGDPETQSASRVTEQRRARRYRLGPVATIRWLGTDGIRHEAYGKVCDLSICGVYVETSARLRLSEIVELEMTPPDLRLSGPEMRFEGEVVRAEKSLG
jgi:PilZ domain